MDASLRSITPIASRAACTALGFWLPSWRAAWPRSCGLMPQPEHGATPLLEAGVAAWSSGLLALCRPQSWIPPQQRLGDACDPPRQAQESLGGPLSEGEPHQVPLCGFTARQWARAHQVILPVRLWLPEVMDVGRYVLCSKPNRRRCTSCEVSCQKSHNIREKVLAHLITLPLTPPVM